MSQFSELGLYILCWRVHVLIGHKSMTYATKNNEGKPADCTICLQKFKHTKSFKHVTSSMEVTSSDTSKCLKLFPLPPPSQCLSPNASLTHCISNIASSPSTFDIVAKRSFQLSNAPKVDRLIKNGLSSCPPCISVSSLPFGQVPAVGQTVVMDSIMAGSSGHSVFT